MMDPAGVPILKLRLQSERHVVHARQRAREIAALLGFEQQDQVRLATAASELARNAFRNAHDGVVEFAAELGKPQHLLITVSDSGPGIAQLDRVLNGTYVSRTGLGKGLLGTQRLMDQFTLESGAAGTWVRIGKYLPASAPPLTAARLREVMLGLAGPNVDAFGEVERQNQELLATLAELRERQEQLAQVNRELEDTNRGVVALYAELEQNATDLRRISDLKTSFLSNLSHEFRTPLNSILGLCRILLDRADGDLSPEQEKQVSYIRRSATDLSELVNDLLDLAKVEAGKVDIRPRAFLVADLFAALRGMLRTLLISTSVELTFSAPDDLPELFTDEPKLSQILRNLISNALKFTERGGVRVSAELAGDLIAFRVSDDGIGIAPEDQGRIFEEFEQVENSIQSRVKGTGLGLPLARKLATLLGGSLEVASSPGVGSVFTAAIPVRFGLAPPQASLPQMQPGPGAGAGPLVLLVEGNPETRFIHENALKGTGLSLLFARDLPEARSLAGLHPPAVLVLDRMLAGEDSLHFIAEMRGSGFRGGVLVVSVMEDSEGPLRAGADAFLAKPVDPAVLSGRVVELSLAHFGQGVMLVDDDEVNRYLLREALAPYRLRIVEARSGREALEIAARQPLSVIFLDVAMPGLTGFETLRELKEGNSRAREVPVVIHTSKDLSPAERDLMRRLGALEFSKQTLALPGAAEALHAILQATGVL